MIITDDLQTYMQFNSFFFFSKDEIYSDEPIEHSNFQNLLRPFLPYQKQNHESFFQGWNKSLARIIFVGTCRSREICNPTPHFHLGFSFFFFFKAARSLVSIAFHAERESLSVKRVGQLGTESGIRFCNGTSVVSPRPRGRLSVGRLFINWWRLDTAAATKRSRGEEGLVRSRPLVPSRFSPCAFAPPSFPLSSPPIRVAFAILSPPM